MLSQGHYGKGVNIAALCACAGHRITQNALCNSPRALAGPKSKRGWVNDGWRGWQRRLEGRVEGGGGGVGGGGGGGGGQ